MSYRQPGRTGLRFSELIRNQLYRTETTASSDINQDDLVQIYLVPDNVSDTGQGAPPASAAAIESLIEITMTSDMLQKDCAVCRDAIVFGDLMKQLPCQHHFHTNCIVPWLNQRNTCPICRHELPTDDEDYDMRRQSIRRIEYSPVRQFPSPSIMSEETQETDDNESENVEEGGDHDHQIIDRQDSEFSLEGVLVDDDNYAISYEEGDEFDRFEWVSDWDNVSDVLFRELMDYERSDNNNNEGDDGDGSYSFGSDRHSRLMDGANLRLQERLNRYMAPLRSEIARLQHQLNNAIQSLRYERARNEQLQRHSHILNGRFSRSDTETLTVQQLQHMELQLHQVHEQICQVLECRIQQQSASQCLRCGSLIDVILRPCNCTCCCQSCVISGLIRCPACYQLIGSFRPIHIR